MPYTMPVLPSFTKSNLELGLYLPERGKNYWTKQGGPLYTNEKNDVF